MRLIDADALLAKYPECRDLRQKVDGMETVESTEWHDGRKEKPKIAEDVLVLFGNSYFIGFYEKVSGGEWWYAIGGSFSRFFEDEEEIREKIYWAKLPERPKMEES